jgi:hypothetical protein
VLSDPIEVLGHGVHLIIRPGVREVRELVYEITTPLRLARERNAAGSNELSMATKALRFLFLRKNRMHGHTRLVPDL